MRVLCEAAKDNVGFSKMLLEIIEKGLKDLQAKWYRQFMLLFEGLLRIEDGLI